MFLLSQEQNSWLCEHNILLLIVVFQGLLAVMLSGIQRCDSQQVSSMIEMNAVFAWAIVRLPKPRIVHHRARDEIQSSRLSPRFMYSICSEVVCKVFVPCSVTLGFWCQPGTGMACCTPFGMTTQWQPEEIHLPFIRRK